MLPRQNVTRQSVTRQNVTEPRHSSWCIRAKMGQRDSTGKITLSWSEDNFLTERCGLKLGPITAARDRALRPKIKFHVIYERLAWEHSAAKVTKSNSRRLPALKRFYRESRPNQLKISKPN